MLIKQISVFLENKSGRLNEVSQILGEAGINISAFSVADTSEFGILRLIVSDPDKASNVLHERGFTVRESGVVGLSCPNQAGALARALKILSRNEISIEYLYAFSMGTSASVIIKPNDIDRCIEVLQKNKLELIKASDLYKI
ncbi:hypothetical protein PbJCM13498_07450 [Prolixibacter bellariivorans]|jgi:hypothetical protein|uniref:ACT domain-containing protein n=1 Tax=Prolixibacter bellariivorans TaxID=314319 RepID=A0A5M4AVB2_9BACT|nr:ACT domain-containing protein [Prolixibacter bellariivorans]GET31882.1 hypothetical protein PbJCM13498_07450 [Prolixibacter bellariivorans]